MGWLLLKAFALDAPCREFAPAGDLLFERPKSRQKVAPAKPPLRCASGSPAMLEARGAPGTRFATLRSDNRAKSVVEARFARPPGFCASRRFRRGEPETAEQPNSRDANRTGRAVEVFRLPPFSTAEQRKDLRARAQHASTTDFARLSERSVAKRVPREPSRPEQRRAPVAKRRAVRPGVVFCLLFVDTKSRSPAGAKSRHGPPHQHRSTIKQPAPHAAEQPQ